MVCERPTRSSNPINIPLPNALTIGTYHPLKNSQYSIAKDESVIHERINNAPNPFKHEVTKTVAITSPPHTNQST
jgi:hypothetical protein